MFTDGHTDNFSILRARLVFALVSLFLYDNILVDRTRKTHSGIATLIPLQTSIKQVILQLHHFITSIFPYLQKKYPVTSGG